MQHVIAYVDGYNLYYGLRDKGWKRFYWLDIRKMVGHFLRRNQLLAETKYFTTIIEDPPDKKQRQLDYLSALRTLDHMSLFFGHYLSDKITCSQCGHTYQTHHEKMTDVNIAVELMSDAFQDRFDVAFLISADSDLVGPIKAIRRLFKKKLVVLIFPPERYSNALAKVGTRPLHISHEILADSQFPDHVSMANGQFISRPERWK